MSLPPPLGLDALIQLVRAQHPDGDALTHLQDAMLLSQQLTEQADHLIGHFVDQARRAGASWSAIGEAMGVTKQAAQKRFVPTLPGVDLPGDAPLSRFTPRARRSLAAAQQEAVRRGAAEVGPVHILLGLLADRDGLAARALDELGATAEQVRAAAGGAATGAPAGDAPAGGAAAGGTAAGGTAAGGTAAGGAPPTGQPPAAERLPFGPAARTVLELTLREALALGHNYIGTEHMLLALFDEGGAATGVLTGLGVTKDRARAWLAERLAEIAASLQTGESPS